MNAQVGVVRDVDVPVNMRESVRRTSCVSQLTHVIIDPGAMYDTIGLSCDFILLFRLI